MHAQISEASESCLAGLDSPQALRVGAIHTPVAAGHVLPDLDALWRGTEFGSVVTTTVSSGWAALDQELPGGGWPCHSLSEVLSPQPSVLEWRLIGPALRQVVAQGGQVVVVGPPKQPHLPGLAHEGLDQRHLVWIQAEAPAERLWVTEQLIKSNAAGAVLAWLPQARQEQIRRLQISAQSCDGLVFLFRPEAARQEASAAPLRLHATYGLDWELQVHVFKRRGPVHVGVAVLPSIPGGLTSVLTPRLLRPSQLLQPRSATPRENLHAVGSPAPRPLPRLHAVH
ncbi:MAG: translesion DNA synthesis-associated protein ImuA [Comamonadaceae bacterium]